MNEKQYIAIDLKSFYASVECVDRGLDPLTTNLVVADSLRSDKTICLAVSPSLKSFGIPGRPRLFEVIQTVRKENSKRRKANGNRKLEGRSCFINELLGDGTLAVDYIVAPPQMAHYIEYSTKIYTIYLEHIAPEDIHAYSIDEVFIDATPYLHAYNGSARQLTKQLLHKIFVKTGITATAGIGTNLYLAKVAMDILGKHVVSDQDGMCIAELNEIEYRKQLWDHRPLKDFWRVGKGYEKKLEEQGLYTMGQIARCSLGKSNEYYNEDLLFKLFGKNAELLIDHAWGYEPCTMSDIKSYHSSTQSVGAGQVLHDAYTAKKARLVVQELADSLSLDLVERGLVTNQIVLTVGYDIENLTNMERRKMYKGEITTDIYGRQVPKHGHGTENISFYTSSSHTICDAALSLYDRIVNNNLLIRRLQLSCQHVLSLEAAKNKEYRYMDLFAECNHSTASNKAEDKEKKLQETFLCIKKKFGKNALLKGTSLEEGATGRERNRQIGGHKA